MTAQEFALQVAAIGGGQVWHAVLVTLLWVVLAAALVTVLWGIGWPGRWLRERHENRKPVTHLVLGAMPDDGEIGDDALAMLREDIDAEWERINRG